MEGHYCPACGEDDQRDRLVVAGTWICGTCFEVHPREPDLEPAS
jgi:ribosomal protein L37AE/L43A